MYSITKINFSSKYGRMAQLDRILPEKTREVFYENGLIGLKLHYVLSGEQKRNVYQTIRCANGVI